MTDVLNLFYRQTVAMPNHRFAVREWPVASFRVEGGEVSLPERTVAELMITEVFCADPELPCSDMLVECVDRGLSAAPVVGPSGELVGFISVTDLNREAYEDALEAEEGYPPSAPGLPLRVRELMVVQVRSVTIDTTIGAAAQLMAKHGVHRLPVVDDEGRVIGILSTMDLARARSDGR